MDTGNDPQPLTEQSLVRRLYGDPWIIWLQLSFLLVVVIDYLFNDDLRHTTGRWFMASLALTLLSFLVPKLPFARKAKNYLLHVAFHALTAFFLIFVAPVGSPYEIILILLLYLSTYWYGTNGFWLSLLAVCSTLELATLHQIDPLRMSDLYDLSLKIILLGLVGGLLQRLHSLDLEERYELIAVSREASYERQRLRSLINSMADAVIATDYGGKVLVYNGAALDLLNTNETLDDKPLRHFVHTYTKQHHAVDLIAQAKHSQTMIKRDDLLMKIGPNEFLNLYASIAQIHLSYGEKGEEGFIMLLRDITKEKSIEEQRDEFVSVVSHELRTPIAITEATISTAQLSSVAKDKKQQGDLLEQAHKNIIFLADMVNDITTLAHAERGDLEAKIEEVKVADLVTELTNDYEKEATAKGLSITGRVDPKAPSTIRSNTYRIKEVLQDFVTNAIKYSDKGRIVISAGRQAGGVRFAVTDSGAGISSSDLRHVFEKFWRSEDYRTRVHTGTGLGLYIAKKLAERLRGRVGVESKLNKGSTFYVDLPLDYDQSDKDGKRE
jgi:two-component system phosphate regulon sensor histidine kinase PhoR